MDLTIDKESRSARELFTWLEEESSGGSTQKCLRHWVRSRFPDPTQMAEEAHGAGLMVFIGQKNMVSWRDGGRASDLSTEILGSVRLVSPIPRYFIVVPTLMHWGTEKQKKR